MKHWRFSLIFSICTCVLTVPATAVESVQASRVAVVSGLSTNWLHQYAASELARYLSQMTGQEIPLVGREAQVPEGRDHIILVGGPKRNYVVRRLQSEGLASIDDRWTNENDGFVIVSAVSGQRSAVSARSSPFATRHYIVLAGKNDRSTLYAVYHYLERFAGCGWFVDGDYVPHRSDIPFDGIDLLSESRFRYRKASPGMRGVAGLKIRVSTYWTAEDWERFIDWLLKRKYNFTSLGGSWIDWAPEGYGCGIWPPDYAKRMDHQIIDWGRARGMGFNLFMRYDSKMGIQPTGDPDDPSVIETTRQVWQDHVDEFGTDHLCTVVYSSEAVHLAGPNERAVRDGYDLWKSIDPRAVVSTETWGHPSFYTPEQWAYFDQTVSKDVVVDDSHVWEGSLSQRLDHFGGRPWTFDFVWPLQAPDQMYLPGSDFGWADRSAEELLTDPILAQNCVGYGWRAESINVNPIFEQFLSEIAWDPYQTDPDDFLQRYAARRFGEQAAPVMLDSLKSAAAAMRTVGGGNNLLNNFGLDLNGWRPESIPGVTEWERALDLALQVRGAQAQNPLYVTTLEDLFKNYCIKLASLPAARFARAYQDVKAGRVERADGIAAAKAEADKIFLIYDQLARVLGSDPRYSWKRLINDVMSVPGARQEEPSRMFDMIGGYYYHFTAEGMRWLYERRARDFLRNGLAEMGCPEQELPLVGEAVTLDRVMHSDEADHGPGKATVDVIASAYEVLKTADCYSGAYPELIP